MTPNVNCFIKYLENEETLANNPERYRNYKDERNFYSSKQTEDYLRYIDKGSKKTDYIDYASDCEKSKGVFGKDGLLNPRKKQELRKKLRKTQSVIWDCLLTFKPEFGEKFCNDYETAYNLLKSELPRFFRDAGFCPDNIEWFAALHTNKEHRHIHISFFEQSPTRIRARKKQPEYSRGKIPLTCIERFKLRTELNLTNAPAKIKTIRKELNDITVNVFGTKGNAKKYNAEFRKGFIELLARLPAQGRLSYASENMSALRPLLNHMTDAAINANPEFKKAFHKYFAQIQKQDLEITEILSQNMVSQNEWDKYLNSQIYLNDFYRRTGNKIINYARVYKTRERKSAKRLVKKRIREKTILTLLKNCAFIQAQLESEAIRFFEEFLDKLNEAKEFSEEHEKQMDY